jgi:hypothetical protein
MPAVVANLVCQVDVMCESIDVMCVWAVSLKLTHAVCLLLSLRCCFDRYFAILRVTPFLVGALTK